MEKRGTASWSKMEASLQTSPSYGYEDRVVRTCNETFRLEVRTL